MMSDYLEKRRRNKVKKMLRLKKPYLMGALLDQEVDRILGISDSGKMDWAMTQKVSSSKYPTPQSIKESDVRKVASEFKIRPYKLYWLFTQKVTKYQASGKTKHDYLAVLRECALTGVSKKLSDSEKITAVMLFGMFSNVTITQEEAQLMLSEGKL